MESNAKFNKRNRVQIGSLVSEQYHAKARQTDRETETQTDKHTDKICRSHSPQTATKMYRSTSFGIIAYLSKHIFLFLSKDYKSIINLCLFSAASVTPLLQLHNQISKSCIQNGRQWRHGCVGDVRMAPRKDNCEQLRQDCCSWRVVVESKRL